MAQRGPKAPASLRAEGRDLWVVLNKRFRWEADQLALVRLLCEAVDRLQQAREIIDREGLCYGGEHRVKRPHPALTIENQARTAVLNAWRALGLDLAEVPSSVGAK